MRSVNAPFLRLAIGFVFALSAFVLPGCGTPSSRERVHQKWLEMLRDLSMIPVFPPREDLRVGDVFVYSVDPDKPSSAKSSTRDRRFVAAATRWSVLAVNEALDEEYRSRPAWPETAEAYVRTSAANETRGWPPQAGAESVFMIEEVPTRLRTVGLGQFSASSFTEGNLNVLIPNEVVNLVFGTAWSDVKAVMIRPHGAESYSLSLGRLIPLIVDDASEEAGKYVLKAELRKHLAFVAAPESNTVWIRVVSQVLYVRSVDISIEAKRTFRDDDELHAYELPESATEADENGDEPEVQEENDDGAAMNHAVDPSFAAFARAKAINQALFDADADDFPGGFIRVLSVTDDSVSIRRVWRHGVAVGVRGLTLEVDTNTGTVLRSGVMLDGSRETEASSSMFSFGGE